MSVFPCKDYGNVDDQIDVALGLKDPVEASSSSLNISIELDPGCVYTFEDLIPEILRTMKHSAYGQCYGARYYWKFNK